MTNEPDRNSSTENRPNPLSSPDRLPWKPCLMLPCHSLEDFPTYLTGNDADQILTTWTVLWHPEILARTRSLPQWFPDDQVPPMIEGIRFLLPQLENRSIDPTLKESLEDEGAEFFSLPSEREAAFKQLSELLQLSERENFPQQVVKDFYALSYTFLQIELICRQLRYSEGVDLEEFEKKVISCVDFAKNGDRSAFEDQLSICYDLLSDQRQRFYPADPLITDLTLSGPTTHKSLAIQIQNWPNFTLQTTVQNLAEFEKSEPVSFTKLQNLVAAKEVEISSPGWIDLPNIFSKPENFQRNISTGQSWLRTNLSTAATTYSQRSTGLDNHTPGCIAANGYLGALYQSFDGLRPPNPGETSFRWEGNDGSVMMSIGKQSIDAGNSSSFLRFGTMLGNTLDEDHLAAFQLTHWPNQVSPFFWDLINSLQKSSALGRLCPLEEVLENLHDPGYCQLDPNQNYPNWLLKKIRHTLSGKSKMHSKEVDAWLGTIHSHYKENRNRNSQQILHFIAQLSGCDISIDSSKKDKNQRAKESTHNAYDENSLPWLADQLKCLTQLSLNDRHSPSMKAEETATQIFHRISGQHYQPICKDETNEVSKNSIAVLNPSSIDLPIKVPSNNGGFTVVPANGFIEKSRSKNTSKEEKKAPRLFRRNRSLPNILSETDSTLGNQFIDAGIDPETGNLRCFKPCGSRKNLLSWQISFYDPALAKIATEAESKLSGDRPSGLISAVAQSKKPTPELKKVGYHRKGHSRMVCEKLEILENSPELGRVRTSGWLKILNQTLAKFELTYQLFQDSHYIEISGKISSFSAQPIIVPFPSDLQYELFPSESVDGSFLCSRLASSGDRIFSNHCGYLKRVDNDLFFSPEYFQLRDNAHRISVANPDVSIHHTKKIGEVDSILSFNRPTIEPLFFRKRFGLGMRSPENIAFCPEPIVVEQKANSQNQNVSDNENSSTAVNGWFIRNTCPLIRIANWENLYENGKWVGANVMLSNQSASQQKTNLEFARSQKSFMVFGSDESTSSQVQKTESGLEVLLMGFETLTLRLEF